MRIRRLGLPQPGRLGEAHAEHAVIVDEIEARRPRRAAKAMTDHIRYAEIYLKRLEKHQQALLPASPQAELALAESPSELTPEQQRVLDRLGTLAVDDLSPRAALDLLYDLARDAKPR